MKHTRFVITGLLLLLVPLVMVVAQNNQEPGQAPDQPDQQNKKPDKILWTSYDDGLERAAQENKHVFVDFTTSWCGWCKKMERETFSRPDVIELVNDNFIPVRVDGDSKDTLNIDGFKITEKSLALTQFGVRGYPTFWFLKPDGSKLGAITGYRSTGNMVEALVYVKDYKYDTTRTEQPSEEGK